MCFEVYVPDQEIDIPYASELIQFGSVTSFEATYTVLVRNRSSRPIDTLNVLYPRSLYAKDAMGDWRLENLEIATELVAPRLRGGSVSLAGDVLSFDQHDPNVPWTNRRIQGRMLRSDAATLAVPFNLPLDIVLFLKRSNITFFVVHLDLPLPPGECCWLTLRASIGSAGQSVPNPLKGQQLVHHQFASPLDVHRTVAEIVETGIESCAPGCDWNYLGPLLVEFRDRRLKLAHQPAPHLAAAVVAGTPQPHVRKVTMEYYELIVETGDPHKRCILNWTAERDLWMRSKSPRFVRGLSDEEVLLHEWKSGSMLEPLNRPWVGEGFALHLTLCGQ